MSEQASFTLRRRNPDVLTCIANLSNDEVFTPPEFANRMLDTLTEVWAVNHKGANLWADPTVRFLDPCTKSGVFLREITRRLTQGLEKTIPDLTQRVNHILTKQVFGIGITQISDHAVRAALAKKGFENPELEWVRCTVKDVKTVLTELQTGQRLTGTHHETFALRREQAEAVEKTAGYFTSIWAENKKAVPRFLWNAKMRFGKMFTSYQLAKKLGAKRVLVVTFKPAVEDAWQTDLESHADFDGWQYLSKSSGGDPTQIDRKKPAVYFGSFQDLLGRDEAGNIKAKNEWLHQVNWDLVVFDEYHFGAWRETAKELFEGEEEVVAKKETKLEYAAGLESVNEDIGELSTRETDFLPITTRAYLYLSGTPFKALATGEFIEEQIFNWTYTDEQRAKETFASQHPGKWNPYGALPQMRLLTYQMPDELVAIANGGEFDEFDLNAFFEASGSGRKRSSSTRATSRSGSISFAAGTRRSRRNCSRWGRGRRFRIPTCACCRISSMRSGFCRTSRRVTRWRTCSRRSKTCSGATTR